MQEGQYLRRTLISRFLSKCLEESDNLVWMALVISSRSWTLVENSQQGVRTVTKCIMIISKQATIFATSESLQPFSCSANDCCVAFVAKLCCGMTEVSFPLCPISFHLGQNVNCQNFISFDFKVRYKAHLEAALYSIKQRLWWPKSETTDFRWFGDVYWDQWFG